MLFDLVVDLPLGVLDGVYDFVADIRGVVLGDVSPIVGGLLGSIFHIAPRLLGCALQLVGYALVGQILVSDSFTNFFFHTAGNLIDFSAYLFFVHENAPVIRLVPNGPAEFGNRLARLSSVAVSEGGTPSTDELNQENYQCYDQQNMDVRADSVKTH
jgi:hypothetical protein